MTGYDQLVREQGVYSRLMTAEAEVESLRLEIETLRSDLADQHALREQAENALAYWHKQAGGTERV